MVSRTKQCWGAINADWPLWGSQQESKQSGIKLDGEADGEGRGAYSASQALAGARKALKPRLASCCRAAQLLTSRPQKRSRWMSSNASTERRNWQEVANLGNWRRHLRRGCHPEEASCFCARVSRGHGSQVGGHGLNSHIKHLNPMPYRRMKEDARVGAARTGPHSFYRPFAVPAATSSSVPVSKRNMIIQCWERCN